ncbi:MAG: A/G-specific adenine glycosylase, partial [Ilumatobacteraceae bacterium]
MLAWGLPQLRELPWRSTRDRWHILVSEVMSQQTQVDRVVSKFLAFVEAYPTPRECADAPLGELLTLWSGLGYPR